MNHLYQGLLHSFVRHGSEWTNFIGNLDVLNGRLSPIREHLIAIEAALDNDASRNESSELGKTLAKKWKHANLLGKFCSFGLPSGVSLSIIFHFLFCYPPIIGVLLRETLLDVQSELYKFLLRNLRYENYLGEGINNSGNQQVYYKVTDRKGNKHVMAICVSKELFEADSLNFGDARPIRTVTTVFFMSEDEYTKRHVGKNF